MSRCGVLNWRAGIALAILVSTGILARVMGQVPEQEQKQEQEQRNSVWHLRLQQRTETSSGSGRFHTTHRSEPWDPTRTAIIVCDVWDAHHSINAVRRVEELAPRIDFVLRQARQAGATIIHAPSECMPAYADHPARQRAIEVRKAAQAPPGINAWCDRIDAEKGFAYPLDQSDGGEDDDPDSHSAWADELRTQGRDPGRPWIMQSPLVTIDAQSDFISDVGEEIWNILQERKIDNVILCGVHTNMCVLGRPFGLRNLVTAGKRVVLVRDLTDTMYNPKSWPFVNHHTGTDLIVEYIEKCICPTITSDQLAGGERFRFKSDDRPLVAIVIAEEEYETNQSLPLFAADYLGKNFRVAFVYCSDENPNDIPGLDVLDEADVGVISVRRRPLPAKQMEILRRFADSRKPLIGIRTASHAFMLRDSEPAPGLESWPEFDKEVWGGNYTGHHGNDLLPTIDRMIQNAEHPILRGVGESAFRAGGSLYKANPLAEKTNVLLTGSIPGLPEEPVAWTFERANGGRSFYTSLGHKDDFKHPDFVRLLFNSLVWATGIKVESSPEPIPMDNKSSDARKGTDLPDSSPIVVADLKLDLLLKEPLVANPLYVNFDERGRLWVVQYRQYPWPAGLKLISRDNVWRNVYQPPFPPPPPHDIDSPFRGHDRITIHEDTDGNGDFDCHKIFLDGLNLATAALKGRGGVYVMNPPYLLFYSDQDNNDLPDSLQPRILLSGFGIEDTHSIANSLRWGPDGWIYGTQGSTVSAAIIRHGDDNHPISGESSIHSMGQNVWRYHPERHMYEIFAEGGGNAFGVEFDSGGRIYSGHNGGDTRGFHYVQGGYYLKNFGKHGLHSNPFTFGFYESMKHHAVERFTHTFEIYEAQSLPPQFYGKLFSVSPILHYVMASDIVAEGSTFMTKDLGPVVTPGAGERASWFTPVDIQTGPDGSLYIADWYSVQSNHYHNHEGQTNPDLGRIYRLRNATTPSFPVLDLGSCASQQLVGSYLHHTNRWYRETALRLLADRKDQSVIPMLWDSTIDDENAHALEALWALNLCGGLNEEKANPLLRHQNPLVRSWTVRLFTDSGKVSDNLAQAFAQLADKETDPEVRLQLACSCRKLETPHALDILRNLLARSEDAADPLIPKAIWWGLESHASQRSEILQWLKPTGMWQEPTSLAANIIENLMRRYAMLGTHDDLLMCASMLRDSPDPQQTSRLLHGFTMAFEGRSIPRLPSELVAELSRVQGRFALVLGIRTGDENAISNSLKQICDTTTPEIDRIQYVRALGEVRAAADVCVPVLLQVLKTKPSDDLSTSCLTALQHFDDTQIAAVIVSQFGEMTPNVQETALSVLSSRKAWSLQLLDAVEDGTIAKQIVNQDAIARLKLHQDAAIHERTHSLFPATIHDGDSINNKLSLLETIVFAGSGNPLEGQKLYHDKSTCGKCHQMYDRGGSVGPDLTSYSRSNIRSMLLAIIHPSAEIREGFENWTVFTEDGQVITGIRIDENANNLVLRTVDGQILNVDKERIEERQQNKNSLMPTGLLDELSDTQLRDLFAFLTSTTPPL